MPISEHWASEVGEWFIAVIEGRQFHRVEYGPGEGAAWPIIVALLFIAFVMHIQTERRRNANQ